MATSKKLVWVLIVLVLLFIASVVQEYLNRNALGDAYVIDLGPEELYCEKDSDCTIAPAKCCPECSYGDAMNKRTLERIMSERDRCADALCSLTYCDFDSCIDEKRTVPKPACVNNRCVASSSPLDCEKVCSSMAMTTDDIKALGCNPDKVSQERLSLACKCMGF